MRHDINEIKKGPDARRVSVIKMKGYHDKV